MLLQAHIIISGAHDLNLVTYFLTVFLSQKYVHSQGIFLHNYPYLLYYSIFIGMKNYAVFVFKYINEDLTGSAVHRTVISPD